MRIDGVPYRTIWVDPDDGWSICVIDQTKLPWSLEIVRLADVAQTAHAIRSMLVRGAPLIGAAAAYGLCLGLRQDPSSEAMERDAELLAATRPTAINLRWALERMLTRLRNTSAADRVRVAYIEAAAIAVLIKFLALRTAVSSSAPLASSAAIADDSEQPVPWVFSVAIRAAFSAIVPFTWRTATV